LKERLQKLMSAAGLCSRRTAETLLTQGRVAVNGRPAVLGDSADPERDVVTVDGRALPQPQRRVYLMLNKPRGYVTTLSDEQGRPTVADLTRGAGARVFPVGRLDLQSQGLVILTNDGDLMQRLIHPKYEVSKEYILTVSGEVADAAARLAAIRALDGEPIRQARVTLLRSSDRTADLSVIIHEGKNRQIRRMCAACGLQVQRLQRVREHTLQLGELPEGHWRYLSEAEVAALKSEG